jgi:hypothetical protein
VGITGIVHAFSRLSITHLRLSIRPCVLLYIVPSALSDLLLYLLAVKLQLCDSPHAIISVLQEQAGAIDQSLEKVLHPTVNANYAFFSSLQGSGLVNICVCSFGTCHAHPFSRYFPSESHICWLRCPLSECFPGFPCTYRAAGVLLSRPSGSQTITVIPRHKTK